VKENINGKNTGINNEEKYKAVKMYKKSDDELSTNASGDKKSNNIDIKHRILDI
jgi:hypothetical protein